MPETVRVRAPGSSANIGPGFDALGIAVSVYCELETSDAKPVGERHPAMAAFRALGGTGPLSDFGDIPPGRGLGFSGATRVAGAAAAVAQRGGDVVAEREAIFRTAGDLERHDDNAAASTFGGVTATVEGIVARVPLGHPLQIVAWIPSVETSTKKSRTVLPDEIPFVDAVYNIGHTALLLASLAAGDIDSLCLATKDALHQDRRLAAVPGSRAALDAFCAASARGCWVSGSGPTIAGFATHEESAALAAALPDDGHVKVLEIDADGVVQL